MVTKWTYSLARHTGPGLENGPDLNALNLGVLFQENSETDRAATLYQAILDVYPDLAEANHNLGILMLEQGKTEQALVLLERAAALGPNQILFHRSLIQALIDTGLHDRARDQIAQARACGMDPLVASSYLNRLPQGCLSEFDLPAMEELVKQGHFHEALKRVDEAFSRERPDLDVRQRLQLLNYAGICHKRLGHVRKAHRCFTDALALSPEAPHIYANIGSNLNDALLFWEAEPWLKKGLAIDPDYVPSRINLANTLIGLGEDDAALKLLDSLINDGYRTPHVINALATVYMNLGQYDAAQRFYEELHQLDPDNAEAWAGRVYLRKQTRADQPWLIRAKALLDATRSPAGRIALLFAMGKFHDDLQCYDLAFEQVTQAHHIKKKMAGQPFDPTAYEERINRMIQGYDACFFSSDVPDASFSERPVFVVGMPRSGTSLVEQILASHPQVHGGGELVFWERWAARHPDAAVNARITREQIQELVSAFQIKLDDLNPAAERIVDKMPGNYLRLGLIHAAFPRARIIHTRRNPLDTCLSIFFKNFNASHAYAHELPDLAFYYRQYQRIMSHWKSLLPSEVMLEVPYEALVNDQEGWTRQMIRFLDLPWDDACLAFHKTRRRVGTASNWQVRQKIYTSSLARWKNYERHLSPLLDLLENKDGDGFNNI